MTEYVGWFHHWLKKRRRTEKRWRVIGEAGENRIGRQDWRLKQTRMETAELEPERRK